MSTRYAQDGLPTKKLIDYHVNRAKGGAAVTIVEPLAMRRNQASNSRVRVVIGPFQILHGCRECFAKLEVG